MAIKTFTTGEVLTAADTNTYLANAGLDYITGTTFTTSSDFNITSCFNATWDSYRIVFSNLIASTNNTQVRFRMLSGTTPLTTNTYYTQRTFAQVATVSAGGTGSTAVSQGIFGFANDLNRGGLSADIFNPFLSVGTGTFAQCLYQYAYQEISSSVVNNTTSYDGIKIMTSAGTISGTVRVYGYRQA